MSAAITAYNASIGKPGVSRTESGKTTKQLKVLFKTADAAVEIARMTQVDFYNAYQKARKIIYTSIGSLAVKALVTDATAVEPLKGVAVSFSLDGDAAKTKAANAKPDLVKKTAEKGGFNIKTLPSGIYTVTIKKNGYTDQVTTVTISGGEMSELNVQLAKS